MGNGNMLTGLSRLAASACLAAILASPVHAATVVTNGSGHATAINGLDIVGTVYDVTFGVGSFTDVFGLNPPSAQFPFLGNVLGADAAVIAITDELSTIPVVAEAGGETANSIIVVPSFGTVNFHGQWTGGGNQFPLPWLNVLGVTGIQSNIGQPGPGVRDYSFALFEKSTAVVPLPAALPLFAGGLGLLGVLGWRRRQAGPT